MLRPLNSLRVSTSYFEFKLKLKDLIYSTFNRIKRVKGREKFITVGVNKSTKIKMKEKATLFDGMLSEKRLVDGKDWIS